MMEMESAPAPAAAPAGAPALAAVAAWMNAEVGKPVFGEGLEEVADPVALYGFLQTVSGQTLVPFGCPSGGTTNAHRENDMNVCFCFMFASGVLTRSGTPISPIDLLRRDQDTTKRVLWSVLKRYRLAALESPGPQDTPALDQAQLQALAAAARVLRPAAPPADPDAEPERAAPRAECAATDVSPSAVVALSEKTPREPHRAGTMRECAAQPPPQSPSFVEIAEFSLEEEEDGALPGASKVFDCVVTDARPHGATSPTLQLQQQEPACPNRAPPPPRSLNSSGWVPPPPEQRAGYITLDDVARQDNHSLRAGAQPAPSPRSSSQNSTSRVPSVPFCRNLFTSCISP